MSKSLYNRLSSTVETHMSADCLLDDLRKRSVVFQDPAKDSLDMETCVISLNSPWLHISLQWKDRRPAFKQVKIFSKDGKSVTTEDVEMSSTKMAVKISSTAVTIRQRVEFDIILTTNSKQTPYPKTYSSYPQYGHGALQTLMKDIATMDVALTFGVNNGARNISLWAHRSVLEQQPGLAKLINKLKAVEGSLTDLTLTSGVQSHHVHEYTLEGYCGLIRFLYTGKIMLRVDLEDFAIGYPPNKPFSIACKKRPILQDLFPLAPFADVNDVLRFEAAGAQSSVRATTYSELFLLADCYEVCDLRAHCRTEILRSMTLRNCLDILFGFAYRFEDLKDEVLQYVSSNLGTMYSGGEDPFDKFNDHPERHALLSEALKLRFVGYDQTNCYSDED